MELQTGISGLLAFASLFTPAEASEASWLYDPRMCFALDAFLGLYGLVITGMFVREKFFRPQAKAADEDIYSDLKGEEAGGYATLMAGAPGRGRNRRMTEDDSSYTGLTKRTDGEYKELPVKRERQRKGDQIYQGLIPVAKDTYDSLQMKQLPAH